MRQLLCLLVLLPGLVQTAAAQAQQQAPASEVVGASAASDVAPASSSAVSSAVSKYLTHKFGIAKEKAAQISQAVTGAAEKYSLPPAVLLAIISIESRFREKAHGANGATGLMQVVPSAHRNLLHNKDLTDPQVNIDVGSSILYGYQRAAGGDLNAAMKNYGGSKAYAEKIRTRAVEFSRVLDTASAPAASDAPASVGLAASAASAFADAAATAAIGASAPAAAPSATWAASAQAAVQNAASANAR
ncbi:lytic transglycosylase domain-containing protein [Paraburkholderia sp. CNPSo 3272]|uniref:transglycosylase SLT domain-containing protein n=1 Tax=Paraburkholderia sp. CNPSo 3272 TaxID=2940931 RepID=UPI0020B73F0A|nr:transglycosylase SLT domain-containing protein [Paraburkholderia sp. CNPSo 3272]MCP3726675.1 lytic transglycosylase domain-containing protein [Paraburkholderia sp. CNPSo 3272]